MIRCLRNASCLVNRRLLLWRTVLNVCSIVKRGGPPHPRLPSADGARCRPAGRLPSPMPVLSSLRLGLTVLSFWPFMPIVARAPLYGRLLVELMLDRRVPASRKAIMGFAVAYVVSPIDLVPDFIPVISRLDDVAAL